MANHSQDTDDALLARLNALKKSSITLAQSEYATSSHPHLSPTDSNASGAA